MTLLSFSRNKGFILCLKNGASIVCKHLSHMIMEDDFYKFLCIVVTLCILRLCSFQLMYLKHSESMYYYAIVMIHFPCSFDSTMFSNHFVSCNVVIA